MKFILARIGVFVDVITREEAAAILLQRDVIVAYRPIIYDPASSGVDVEIRRIKHKGDSENGNKNND